MNRPRAILLSLSVGLLVLGGSYSAYASLFGPVGNCGGKCCVCYADGSLHTYNNRNLSRGWRRAFNRTFNKSYRPTDLRVKWASFGLADVRSYTRKYGNNGWNGKVICVSHASSRKCNKWNLYINQTYGPYSRHQRNVLACHEFGHTLGLNHVDNNNSCMDTYGPLGSEKAVLTRHERRHLNRRY